MNPHHWAGVQTPAMNRRTRSSPFPRQSRPRMEGETPVLNRQTRFPFPESHQTRKERPRAASSKTVDIPVRFFDSVRSEKMRTTAAMKIQKVFRGLLVRKSVKKIDRIRKEVDEIEKRVSVKETILLMRRDSKERLKVNEMLMKLLIRLDSIRGVDSGVRVFRKSVIKKAIMLQERVDEIVYGDVEMVDKDNLHTIYEIEDENLKEDEEEEEDLMDIQQQSELIQGDLMERMIKGNEMLTGLVAQLCERQESQSRLLSSLSQRVENLEKAFRSERSNLKKKRNNNINKL